MKKPLLFAFPLLALGACSDIPPEAYYNRGNPESLLDVSSETVNVGLATPGSVNQLADMVTQDPPARAELHCSQSQASCSEAKRVLDKLKVPVQFTNGEGGGATLVYERVVARDCEQRYIDNSINPYNLNHPTFGCSLAGNMVQEVSDKRQFSSPSLLDFQDGAKAVQVYQTYQLPSSATASTTPAPSPLVPTASQ